MARLLPLFYHASEGAKLCVFYSLEPRVLEDLLVRDVPLEISEATEETNVYLNGDWNRTVNRIGGRRGSRSDAIWR